jgi:GNAT superfamily N-acetyltransferase
MDFRPIVTDDNSLTRYAALFRACFPNAVHLGEPYLRWLYRDNPDGEVIGFDAFEGDRLAAHYACIPVTMEAFGREVRGMLSLNTATHPDFQGKGLFTQLAARTYELGQQKGLEAVYGIANANSTPGFIRKLGFALVSPLDARLGVGAPATIDWNRARELTQFRRLWSGASLAWRCASPANRVHVTRADERAIEVRAATDKPLISVWGPAAPLATPPERSTLGGKPLTLFIGLLPEGAFRYGVSLSIPDRLRPSPLNFIYRPLASAAAVPERGGLQCSFVDFDAY